MTGWSYRFWCKVARSSEGECWPWMAMRNRAGYGRIKIDGSMQLAHRASFFLAHGRWPEPFCCHRCDNPSCVNPAHLFEGTHADNTADMVLKGRQARSANHWTQRARSQIAKGERHGMARLSEVQAREIKSLLASGAMHQDLAGRFGVSRALITRIAGGSRWGWL